jgi:hypothetical protein
MIRPGRGSRPGRRDDGLPVAATAGTSPRPVSSTRLSHRKVSPGRFAARADVLSPLGKLGGCDLLGTLAVCQDERHAAFVGPFSFRLDVVSLVGAAAAGRVDDPDHCRRRLEPGA